MKDQVKIIALDADDTLWVNEPYFRESEKRFAEMMEEFLPAHSVERALLKTEIENISFYGYGVKSFMLSMVETAINLSDGKISGDHIGNIIQIGRDQLSKPVEIIEGVPKVLHELSKKYRLVMATKGDLMEQQSKLNKSGLEEYFHHIEIVSEKKENNYEKLINHLDIPPAQFLMIGNSLKSDIIPVLNIGGFGIHIPFHTTWEYEKVTTRVDHPKFKKLDRITDLLNVL